MNWSKPFDKGTGVVKRGRGFGISIKAVITPTTSVAIVNVSADGSVTLYCGTIDMGQGSDTAMAQMVGEVLNIPAETVRVVPRDTDVTPYDMGTLGSRSLFHMGHAVQRAAEDARDKLKALAREVGEPEGSNIPVARAVREEIRHAGRQRDRHRHLQAGLHPARAGHRPVRERHARSGWCRAPAPRSRSTPRPGTSRSPSWSTWSTSARRSIRGSSRRRFPARALMQLGFTMFEKMHIDGGQVTNASLADYKIPGFHDVPIVMDNSHVDTNQSNGPFGAKGVGEVATFCVSPAIANAIDDAVGVRLTELPLNPEAVYRAIRAKAGKPLEDE